MAGTGSSDVQSLDWLQMLGRLEGTAGAFPAEIKAPNLVG